jgi:hypothetical protein
VLRADGRRDARPVFVFRQKEFGSLGGGLATIRQTSSGVLRDSKQEVKR